MEGLRNWIRDTSDPSAEHAILVRPTAYRQNIGQPATFGFTQDHQRTWFRYHRDAEYWRDYCKCAANVSYGEEWLCYTTVFFNEIPFGYTEMALLGHLLTPKGLWSAPNDNILAISCPRHTTDLEGNPVRHVKDMCFVE